MPTALITGVSGQTGSYLAELLISKGYVVHGMIRRSSLPNTQRIDHLYQEPGKKTNFFLHYGDITDSTSLRNILLESHPDEVYHLAAQSHVRVSFDQPEYTAETVAMGTLKLLEACREYQRSSGKQVKIYHAASSEMFGSAPPPQNEYTVFHPRSPYGVAKVAAFWHCVNYREAYGMFICNGISFNHESPRRGITFVTRKITRGLSRIKYGLQEQLVLGNLTAQRDWIHAADVAQGMWAMMQAPIPDDFVLASGYSYSVQEFLERTATILNLDWQRHVVQDATYMRPTEVDHLRGDARKAQMKLGWTPSITFDALVQEMVAFDSAEAEREQRFQLILKHQGGPA